MSFPPSYSDLGKKAKDIFEKDYKTGVCNFDLKSKTCTGTEIKITGTHDQPKQFFDSVFEYKSKIACGISTKIKVDSKWNLTNETEISDRLIRNLKQTAIATIKADEALKMFTLKNCHTSSFHHVEADMFFKEACPKTVSSLVLGPLSSSLPIFAGVTATMEPKERTPSKAAATLFHSYKDLQLCLAADKEKNVNFSAFHATTLADFALKIGYNFNDKTLKSGAGFLYKPSPATFIKGKIDNQVNIGISYGVKVTEGLNLIFSTLFDGKKPQEPHQMGFTIEAVI